jgi:hypothetical protein
MEGHLTAVEDLDADQRDQMFGLFSKHFETARRDVFDADLDEKNWAILLHDGEGGPLKGFSSMLMYQAQHEGEDFTVVYSGDTIMDPEAWQSSVLSRSWISAVRHVKAEHFPDGRLFWLLISSGFRTYRFLPTFWQDFYPRHDAETPPEAKARLDALARDRFGEAYDADAGVVRFPHPQVLREGLRGIPEKRMSDDHVAFFDEAFFDEKNPGHENGDELVCLTEISEENLTRAGRRMWFTERPVVTPATAAEA